MFLTKGILRHRTQRRKRAMKWKKALTILISLTAFISLTLFTWAGAAQAAAAPEPKGKLTYSPSTGTMSYRKAIDPHTGVGAEQTTINTLIFDSLITKDPRGR